MLKLGATCASSGIAIALRDTNIAEKITMKVEFTGKKRIRANPPCLKNVLANAYTGLHATCVT